MDPLVNSRDYYSELERGLSMMFGDGLVSFDLRQEHQMLPSFGPSGIFNSTSTTTYTLLVNVHINVSDRLKEGFSTSHQSMRLDSYGPVRISQTQELRKGKIIMRVEYSTHDLNGFLDVLKDKTWGKFEKEFTEQLEAKLNEDS